MLQPAAGPAETVSWRYDGARLVEVTDAVRTERFEHDARGRLAARTLRLTLTGGQAATYVTRYAYDARGALARQSLPDGRWLVYKRNAQGQVTALHLEHDALGAPWLAGSRTTIVRDLQRDLVGLRALTYGNGIEARWQRSQVGVLARVAYTRPGGVAARGAAPAPAQDAQPAAPGAQAPPTEAGALFDARLLYDAASNVLLQARHGRGIQRTLAYGYDARDQLVAAHRFGRAPEPAAVPAASSAPALGAVGAAHATETPEMVWRYLYDAHANRVLAQEQVPTGELGHTRRVRYGAAGDTAALPERQAPASAPGGGGDAAPERRLRWDAHGRLVQLEQGALRAHYRYDHRGLRVSKTVSVTGAGAAPAAAAATEHTLYNEQRQRTADLDAQGRLVRQYVWLGEQLVATLDAAQPGAPAEPAHGAWARLRQSVRLLWAHLAGPPERIAYVHANHLGAPVATTDAQGALVWQADYAPFGALVAERSASASAGSSNPYRLALRLPGQWADPESGLHYNDARYYDPNTGRYLSADPLGALAARLGSTNAYAYVNNNPASWVDPLGLILFAFDGTGNTNDTDDLRELGASFSNVWRFAEAYQSGRTNYVTGVGTIHRDDKYGDIEPDTYARGKLLDWLTPDTPLFYNDMGGNYSGPARVDRMVRYINDEADSITDDNQVMDIDIVGFSRGAAQAREFANRIVAATQGGYYRYRDPDGSAQCQRVNFRFMGLFDTVLSTNFSGGSYNLAIPEAFKYVAHAVALNEYRSDDRSIFDTRNPLDYRQHWGGFALESIGPTDPAAGHTRIERGFLGAHADIGGGYPEGQNELSLVALQWMVAQARAAGVEMDAAPALPAADPVLHDKSNAMRLGDPRGFGVRWLANEAVTFERIFAEDRAVHGAPGGATTQRNMRFGAESMTNADTHTYIRYLARDANAAAGSALDPQRLGQITASVDIAGYVRWLREHRYGL